MTAGMWQNLPNWLCSFSSCNQAAILQVSTRLQRSPLL